MISGYMLTEARDAEPGEDLWALGHRYRKEGDGEVRYVTHVPETDQRAEDWLRLVAGLRQGWDAAWPPKSPPNVEFVAGYIGGGTPHVWSDDEWASALAGSSAQYTLPIFVRVPPTTRDPVIEANFSADWAERHGQPHGTLIALDYETSTVQSYLSAFDAQIVKRGYKTVVYGSRSFVLQLKAPSGGRWTATWNNVPHIDPGAVMTQYGGDVTLGQPYDLNVAGDIDLWRSDMSATGPASWDAADWKAHDARVQSNVTTVLRKAVGPDDATVPAGVYFDRVEHKLDLLADLATGELTAQEVADLVVAGVGPEVAASVAALIGAKLSAN